MIYLASDHGGFELKEKIKAHLLEANHDIEDLGAHSLDKSDDYPDYAFAAAKKVAEKGNDAKALLFCGSADGMCIAANKVKGVRAVSAWNPITARTSREKNNANVLCLAGGATLSPIPGLTFEEAKEIIDVWLSTPFSGEERHARRLKKISDVENLWLK
jgi:ribose 5-phosphate isomerase B